MPESETIGCCSTDSPRPLFFGRLFRVLTGVATLAAVPILGVETLSGWGLAGLLFLGVSFIVSGLTGNPGCEVTAIPNLLLPAAREIHCFCPLWTPVDKLEHRAKRDPEQNTTPR